MSFHNRRWIFLDSDNLSGVNFNQMLETSAETLRYSVDSGMFFVKYNITEYPVDPDAPNVDISGNTWEFYYESIEDNPNFNGDPVVTGSGILYNSGQIVGRPDCYNLAVEISGKTEWGHEDVLEYLATPDWTPTGMM